MFELLLGFDDKAGKTPVGFRKGRSSIMACNLLNDVCCVFKDQKSPLFMSTLGAVECFDKIWHPGLFYKLYGHMDRIYWVFMIKWYSLMKGVVT